jgi:hypothetical protein
VVGVDAEAAGGCWARAVAPDKVRANANARRRGTFTVRLLYKKWKKRRVVAERLLAGDDHGDHHLD